MSSPLVGNFKVHICIRFPSAPVSVLNLLLLLSGVIYWTQAWLSKEPGLRPNISKNTSNLPGQVRDANEGPSQVQILS